MKIDNLPKMKPHDSEPMMIVRDLDKIYHDKLRKNSENVGIPSGYRYLLMMLYSHNGCTQYELAKLSRLKPPTVSLTLKKMEDDGYIVRESSEKDMRVTNVFLTEAGAKVHLVNIQMLDHLDEVAVKGFSDDEKETLLSLLKRLRSNLCEEFGISEHTDDCFKTENINNDYGGKSNNEDMV